jgi:hypothetical protein
VARDCGRDGRADLTRAGPGRVRCGQRRGRRSGVETCAANPLVRGELGAACVIASVVEIALGRDAKGADGGVSIRLSAPSISYTRLRSRTGRRSRPRGRSRSLVNTSRGSRSSLRSRSLVPPPAAHVAVTFVAAIAMSSRATGRRISEFNSGVTTDSGCDFLHESSNLLTELPIVLRRQRNDGRNRRAGAPSLNCSAWAVRP